MSDENIAVETMIDTHFDSVNKDIMVAKCRVIKKNDELVDIHITILPSNRIISVSSVEEYNRLALAMKDVDKYIKKTL